MMSLRSTQANESMFLQILCSGTNAEFLVSTPEHVAHCKKSKACLPLNTEITLLQSNPRVFIIKNTTRVGMQQRHFHV